MRHIYHGTFKDQNGAVVGSSTTSDGNAGTVTVYLAGTDTLADVYVAEVGGTAVNSVSTDAYGYFYFWVDDATYTIDQRFKIVLSHPDFITRTYDNISIVQLSTTYLQTIVNAADPEFIQTGTGAVTSTLETKAREVFSASDFTSFAVAVTALSTAGGGRLNVIGDTYTVDADLSVPSTIEVCFWDGGMISVDSGMTVTFLGRIQAGLYQIFSGSGTVVFSTTGPIATTCQTEIHPEWWGTFPNGTNDTAILNKAIAASDIDSAFDGLSDATIIVNPGRYYITPGGLSTITCNFFAHNAQFITTANTSLTDSVFTFDFSDCASFQRIVDIGLIHNDVPLADTDHYNVGLTVVAGDNANYTIGQLSNLHYGIVLNSSVTDEHIGINTFRINTVVGCDYGILLVPGDGSLVAQCEANRFYIEYMTWNKNCIVLSSVTGDKACCTNSFDINSMELHAFDNANGIIITGPMTFSNIFQVFGNIIPPTGTGYIITTADTALENIFRLAYGDLDKMNLGGGYNVLLQDGTGNTYYPASVSNALSRSTVMWTNAPVNGPWRVGDKVWNSAPAAAGYAGWVCVTAGTPGTWKGFGVIES